MGMRTRRHSGSSNAKRQGFTLVELTITMCILALLATIGFQTTCGTCPPKQG